MCKHIAYHLACLGALQTIVCPFPTCGSIARDDFINHLDTHHHLYIEVAVRRTVARDWKEGVDAADPRPVRFWAQRTRGSLSYNASRREPTDKGLEQPPPSSLFIFSDPWL